MCLLKTLHASFTFDDRVQSSTRKIHKVGLDGHGRLLRRRCLKHINARLWATDISDRLCSMVQQFSP